MILNVISKVLIIAAIAAASFGAYNIYQNNQELETKGFISVNPTVKEVFENIDVDATVVPLKEIDVSSELSGKLEWIGVKEGDKVYSGQHIASIEHKELLTELAQAEASLKEAEAVYKKLQSGASKEDIEIAKQSVKEAEILVNTAKIDLANALKLAVDFIDKNIDTIDKYFKDDPTQERYAQLNVKYISSDRSAKLEETRRKLFDDLDRTNQIARKLYETEDLNELSYEEVLQDGKVVLDTITTLKLLTDDLFEAADDALTVHPSNIALNNLKQDMLTLKPLFAAEKQKLDTAVSALELASAKLKIAKANLDKVLAPARDEDLEAAEARIKLAQAKIDSIKTKIAKARIIAPSSGTVSQVFKEVGEYVNPQEPIVKLITDGVYVQADVPEVDISKVKLNSKVKIKFDAYKDKEFSGNIYFISPEQKEKNKIIYYEVKIALDDYEGEYEILPGMSATVYIPVTEPKEVVLIPASAVHEDPKGKYVLVIKKRPNNMAIEDVYKRYVELGETYGAKVEVKKGVGPEDRIVIPK